MGRREEMLELARDLIEASQEPERVEEEGGFDIRDFYIPKPMGLSFYTGDTKMWRGLHGIR